MSTRDLQKQWHRAALVGLGLTLGCDAGRAPVSVEAPPPPEHVTPPSDTGTGQESPAEMPPVASGPETPASDPKPPAVEPKPPPPPSSSPRDPRRAWWRGSFHAGVGPEALGVGDFDGDGAPDVVVGLRDRDYFEDDYMWRSGGLRMLRNDGRGRLVAGAHYPLNAPSARVVTGDLNADGQVDVLVGTELGARVLAGQGTGSLVASEQWICEGKVTSLGIFKTPSGAPRIWALGLEQQWTSEGFCLGSPRAEGDFELWQPLFPLLDYNRLSTSSATVADFNEDGLADILFGREQLLGEGKARLFLGDGSERDVRAVSFPLMPSFSGVYSADFNHDGHPDMLGREPDSMSVWLGTGQGGFTFAARYELGRGEPILVNLDADVFPDVVVLSGDTASLWRGGEGGVLRHWSRITVGRQPLSAATADLNGDGTRELLVAEADDNVVSVYEIPPKPESEPWLPFTCPVAPAVPPLADVTGRAALATLDVGGGSVRGAGGDFDGDGREDLALALAAGGVRLVLHTDEDRLPTRELETLRGRLATSLVAGDFDGDGRADVAGNFLVSGRPPGDPLFNILVLWNDAGLSFTQSLELRHAWWMDRELLAGDFNGDGLVDLASAQVGYSGQGAYGDRYTSLGQRNFREDWLNDYNGSADGVSGDRDGLPRAADFNGDGTLDLVYMSRGINLIPTSAEGRTLPGGGHGFSYGVGGGFLSATDVDGDGRADLVTADMSGIASLMPGDGHGALRSPIECQLPAGARIKAWEDLDGNGTADLVTTTEDGKRMWVVPRTKQGQWAAARVYDLDSAVLWVRPVDLLGDPRPELAVMLHSGRLLVFSTSG